MTIITIRNGVMAADRLITAGSTRFGLAPKMRMTKDGWYAAGAGDVSLTHSFLTWISTKSVRSIRSWKDDPIDDWSKSPAACIMMMSPEGDVFMYQGMRPVKLGGDFFAEGSGRELAIGALDQGATAIEAALCAARHDPFCGGGIDYGIAGSGELRDYDTHGDPHKPLQLASPNRKGRPARPIRQGRLRSVRHGIAIEP